MTAKLLISMVLPILLVACHAESSPPSVWDSPMERKGFECLRTEGEKIQSALEMTEENLSEENGAAMRDDLINARRSVQVLVNYEVPIIEARQRVYDAWWLYTAGRIEEMNHSLDQASNLFSGIMKQGDTPFYRGFGEIKSQIKHIKLTVEKQYMQTLMRHEFQGPYSVTAQFHQLIDKVDIKVLSSADLIN